MVPHAQVFVTEAHHFSVPTSVLVSSACHNKIPQTERLENKLFSHSSGGCTSGIRVPVGSSSAESSLRACRCPLLTVSSHGKKRERERGRERRDLFLFPEGHNPIRLQPHPYDLIEPNISQRPYLWTQLHWKLGLPHITLGERQFSPQYPLTLLLLNIMLEVLFSELKRRGDKNLRNGKHNQNPHFSQLTEIPRESTVTLLTLIRLS